MVDDIRFFVSQSSQDGGFKIFLQRKCELYVIVVTLAQVSNKMAELTLLLFLVWLFFSESHMTKNSDPQEDYLKFYQR